VIRSAAVSFIAAQVSEISGFSLPMSETSRLDDLPLDSLQCLELTAAIEDEYDICISCSDRIGVETIGDFADLVVQSRAPLLQAA
jgi:acyl carrier protein